MTRNSSDDEQEIEIVQETADFLLPAEVSEDPQDSSKPIRLLESFSIKDAASDTHATMAQIGYDSYDIIATGLVLPVFAEPEEDDDMGHPVMIRTSSVISSDIIFREDGTPVFWIETDFAWYQLGTPDTNYQEVFVGFSKAALIAGFVIKESEDETDLTDIRRKLLEYRASIGTCEVQFFQEDWDLLLEDIKHAIEDYGPSDLNTSLIKQILGRRKRKRVEEKFRRTRTQLSEKKQDLSETTLTPLVNKLCAKYNVFRHRAFCYGDEKSFFYPRDNFDTLEPKKKPSKLQKGQVVKVNQNYYMIQRLEKETCHLIKVVKGKETLLNEYANDLEFYAIPKCRPAKISDLQLIDCPDVTLIYEVDRFRKFNNLDSCFACEKKQVEKIQTATLKSEIAMNLKPVHCLESFVLKNKRYYLNDYIYFTPKTEYSLYLFGQIISITDKNTLKRKHFELNVSEDKVITVCLLGRVNDLNCHDLKTLFKTTHELQVQQEQIRGHLCVIPLKNTKPIFFKFDHNFTLDHLHQTHDPRHYCELKKQMLRTLSTDFAEDLMPIEYENMSPSCILMLNEQHDLHEFSKQQRKFKALDLFSGCGGLTVGFDDGFMPTCDTKHAIEMNKHAALTFERNFKATVYKNDCNQFLKNEIIHKNHEFEAIYCGPPCQGFSGLNQFRKSEDSKNNLIATSLSFVELYRPRMFLLENVVGLLSYSLGGWQESVHKVSGGIRQGVLKFIVRTLLELGYQVTWSVLQAGNFGLPQNRKRVIVFASLDFNLITWPEPTFLFTPQTCNIHSPMHEVSYCKVKHALFPPTTVDLAISDLEPFEYINPNKVMMFSNLKDKTLNESWPKLQACFSSTLPVGPSDPKYMDPVSDFQKELRQNSSKLKNHYTRSYNEMIIERICNIPYFQSADHSSLPQPLKPWALSHPDSASSKHNGWKGLYGRLNKDGFFRTATTDMNPMSKTGTILHPQQNRIITVREIARSQGFPDYFEFFCYENDVREQYRQIGNAVPPKMAMKISFEVMKSLKESQ